MVPKRAQTNKKLRSATNLSVIPESLSLQTPEILLSQKQGKKNEKLLGRFPQPAELDTFGMKVLGLPRSLKY